VLAALPTSPEELPLAQALREEIMLAVDAKLSSLPAPPELDEVRQMAAAAAARLDALENAPAPEVGISPEQVLAALPTSPEELPLAQALRSELLERIDAGLSARASTEAVEELRRHMETAQEQLDAMPETLARLAASTTPALQELEHGVSSLGTLVQELRQGLDGMKEALAEKDAAIAAMREEGEWMREEIDALNARLDTLPDATVLKNEMEEHVRQQVPATVARVIRKEIQALLKEMEG
jgi:chromosome segregation ATPase